LRPLHGNSNSLDHCIITHCWLYVFFADDSETASLSELDSVSENIGMDAMASFKAFQTTHSKKYDNKEEHDKRFGIWKDNLHYVHKWNSDKGNSFELGMNEFADLSDEEFTNTYLNPQMHEEYQESETFMAAEEERRLEGKMSKRVSFSKSSLSKATLGENADVVDVNEEPIKIMWHKNSGKQPSTVDWHSKLATSSVNNQAKCFACYAFATCGAIEAAKFLQTGKVVKLSAQQIVDCSSQVGGAKQPGSEIANHGCKGGTMVKSYKYIHKYGVMKASEYGYNTVLNSKPSCKFTASTCKYDAKKATQKILGYVNVREGNEKDLQNAVGQRPVSVAIDAHHRAFKLYRAGVFSLSSCTTHLTHGVLMIGYGEKDGKKFWKIKNSWGTTWGENGYGTIIRGKDMCSIADWSNYPIVNADEMKKISAVATLSELTEVSEAVDDTDDSEAADDADEPF